MSSEVLVGVIIFLVGQSIAGMAFLRSMKRERLERSFEYAFNNGERILTEMRWLSSRNPVVAPAAPDEIDTNELLDRTWRVKRNIDSMALFTELQLEERKLVDTLQGISKIVGGGYELILKRDVTGQNILKACGDRLEVFLFQLKRETRGTVTEKQIRMRLNDIGRSYGEGDYIPPDILCELTKS